jgi:hypothetical protein
MGEDDSNLVKTTNVYGCALLGPQTITADPAADDDAAAEAPQGAKR